MAKIKGKLFYGAMIEIDVPIAPSKAMLEPFVSKAEAAINVTLEKAVKTSVAPLAFLSGLPLLGWLKGAKITITGSKSRIEIEDSVP